MSKDAKTDARIDDVREYYRSGKNDEEQRALVREYCAAATDKWRSSMHVPAPMILS